jgi:hypothetical protein
VIRRTGRRKQPLRHPYPLLTGEEFNGSLFPVYYSLNNQQNPHPPYGHPLPEGEGNSTIQLFNLSTIFPIHSYLLFTIPYLLNAIP